jgi:DNA-binding YbaB/EbfC family protein
MKLPKNFGGAGFSGMMQQMQSAMARARQLEDELEAERIGVDKGPVKAIFDGTGRLLKLTIGKEIVDPDDVEALEDLVVSAIRDGFEQSTALRNAKVNSIMPHVPEIPGV